MTSAQDIVPTWFKELPEPSPGIMYAIGYSGKYKNVNTAKRKALENALINMAKQRLVHLKFYFEEIGDGRMTLSNPFYEVIYNEDILLKVKEDYYILDSSATANGYFVLVAHPAPTGSFRTTRQSIVSEETCWGIPPEWIYKTPESEQWAYGVGMGAKYSKWTKAWQDVDEFARFDLGKNTTINTESIHVERRTNRSANEAKILRQSYDMFFKDSVIIARYYDDKTGSYYSLARAPR